MLMYISTYTLTKKIKCFASSLTQIKPFVNMAPSLVIQQKLQILNN